MSSSELTLKYSSIPGLTNDSRLVSELHSCFYIFIGLYFICLHGMFSEPDRKLLDSKKNMSFISYPGGWFIKVLKKEKLFKGCLLIKLESHQYLFCYSCNIL